MPAGLRIRLKRVRGVTEKGVLPAPLVLPALIGGEFSWTEEASFREYETHRAGQFAIPAGGGRGARMLRDISDLETLTLDWDAPWLQEAGISHGEMRRQIMAIHRARTPVELLASVMPEGAEELRCLITIRSITKVLRHGEADTRYWTLSIREHRQAETERRTADAKDDKLPTRHRITEDTTFRSLARHYYGSEKNWKAIAKANGMPKWGGRTPIAKSKKFKVRDFVKIPKEPKASKPKADPRTGGVEAP